MGSGSQAGLHSSSQPNGCGQGFGGMMGGSGKTVPSGTMGTGGMGAGMMANLSVGLDGTPYLVRRTTPATAGQMMRQPAQAKSELVALDPQTGATKWKLERTSNHISEPSVARDDSCS